MPLSKKFRVLFVEDSEIDKEIAEREMIRSGLDFTSTRVETEEEYLNEVTNNKPDIIISDYSLPTFDGMSALKIALKMRLQIPFILMTGSTNEETAVECMKAGADDYIIKENLNRLVPALWAAVEKHQNIIAKKLAEKELLKSERRFRTLFSENLAPMILVDPETHQIVDANKAAENFYGWRIDQLKEKRINDINTLSDEDILAEMKNAVSQKRIHFQFKHRTALGEIRDVEVYSSAIMIGDKKILHSIIHDITEKKRIENELTMYQENLETLVKQRTKELDRANKKLEENLDKRKILESQLEEALSKEKEINELKTRFIATVSHEFRTPLAALYSTTQMIERYSHKWSPEKIKEHHQQIENTIRYLTQLLDDVLTVSRADREIVKHEPEFLKIKELIDSFINEAKSNDNDNHDIVLNLDTCVSTLEIDPKLLRHSVVNLLLNAIKYSPPNSQVLLDVITKDNTLEITVSDEGIGIPEDEIDQIFDAFYRTNNSIGIKGTGLGLNIVKRSVEIMGGTISVKSEVNKGTTFILKIPVNCK